MSLGNVPRRNMSAEDMGIRARLLVHQILMNKHEAAGMGRDAASKAAFDVAVKLTRKQAEKLLEQLITEGNLRRPAWL